MAITLTDIGVGSAPNDGTGDTARTAGQSINANNTTLETAIGGLQGRFWTIQNSSTTAALGDRLLANNHAGITLTMPGTFANDSTAYSDIWIANADDAANVTLTPATGDAFFVDGATHGIDTTYALTPGNMAILSPRTTDSEWDLVLVGGASGGGFTSIVDDETYGNYAIGLNALDSLTSSSGLDNIAIGENAGTAITTGDGNTFVGDQAGKSVTSNYNVFIGRNSGLNLTSGANNTAVGHGALAGAGSSTAATNTAFGYNTLSALSTGGRNIAIGYSVGSSLTTAEYCLIIGYNSQPSSSTNHRQLLIGGISTNIRFVAGRLSTALDEDVSAEDITITGTSAAPSATTNLSAGDLILQGGLAATTGAGVGGDLVLRGGAPGSTGTGGFAILQDAADNTKQAKFDLSGITTATTRTITIPDEDITLGKPTECLVIACSDETTDLSTGTAKVTFRMPYAMSLSSVKASVTTAPVGSTIIVDINEGGSTIMTTNKLSIDASEKTSTTAATAPGITDSALADDAEITIDIDQVGSSTAGAGLKVYLIGTRA